MRAEWHPPLRHVEGQQPFRRDGALDFLDMGPVYSLGVRLIAEAAVEGLFHDSLIGHFAPVPVDTRRLGIALQHTLVDRRVNAFEP
jgi:hypothetical protein